MSISKRTAAFLLFPFLVGAAPPLGKLPPPPSKQYVYPQPKGKAAGFLVSGISFGFAGGILSIAALGRKAVVSGERGLYVWDIDANDIKKEETLRPGSETVTAMWTLGSSLLVRFREKGGAVWGNGGFRRIRFRPLAKDSGSEEQREENAFREPSNTLLGAVLSGSAVFGVWAKEGLLESRDGGITWLPLTLSEKVGFVSPVCVTETKGGYLVCGARNRRRGYLFFLAPDADQWKTVPGFEEQTISLFPFGNARVIAGLGSSGAVLVDLTDGRTWKIPALAGSGRVFQLLARKDGGYLAATEKGLVVLSRKLKREARLGRREGLAGDFVKSLIDLSTDTRERYLVLCVGAGRRGRSGLTLLERRRGEEAAR